MYVDWYNIDTEYLNLYFQKRQKLTSISSDALRYKQVGRHLTFVVFFTLLQLWAIKNNARLLPAVSYEANITGDSYSGFQRALNSPQHIPVCHA
jgi:hypothetical protein